MYSVRMITPGGSEFADRAPTTPAVAENDQRLTMEALQERLAASEAEKAELRGKVAQLTAESAEKDEVIVELRAESKNKDEDRLTGFSNRRSGEEQYLTLMTPREERRNEEQAPGYVPAYKQPNSVLMIDIDNFKFFNDHKLAGHEFGDILLQTVAEAIRAIIRTRDIAVRYGGDELVVMTPRVGLGGALVAARNIIWAVRKIDFREQNPKLPEELRRVTVSIGVGRLLIRRDLPAKEQITADKQPVPENLGLATREADRALFEAKRNHKDIAGRDCVVVNRNGVFERYSFK